MVDGVIAESQLPPPEQPTLRFESASHTIASSKHPERNEDTMIHTDNVYAIFDGVGGSADGDKASQLAAQTVGDKLKDLSRITKLTDAEQQVRQSLVDAGDTIIEQRAIENAKKTEDEKKNDMASTGAVIALWTSPEGKQKAIIGTVGDSRVYRMRNGVIEQITIDDNELKQKYGHDFTKFREIQQKLNNISSKEELGTLTEEEKYFYDNRNLITQALGEEPLSPSVQTIDVIAGDQLFVMSDGITDNLTDNELAEIIAEAKTPDEIVKLATERAYARSQDASHIRKKPDDISIIAVRAEAVTPEPSLHQEKPLFQVGETVRVKRSDYSIDEGWTVDSISTDGTVTVTKPSPDNPHDKLQKTFASDILAGLNRPQTFTEIVSARTFDDLVQAVRNRGGIATEQTYYTSDELIDIINKVRKGELPLKHLTRTSNIRTVVEELMSQETLDKLAALSK